MRRTLRYIVFAVISLFVLPVWAVTLDECIADAVACNPGMEAARLAVDRARVYQGTAVDIPYTAVSLKQDPTGGGGTDNGIGLSQDFDFPSLYVARSRALRYNTELERLRADLKLRQLERDVTAAYWSLVHARTVVALRRVNDSLYASCAEMADTAYSRGLISRLDLLNARRIMRENTVETVRAVENANAAGRVLGLLTGHDSIHSVADTLAPLATLPQADAPEFGLTPEGRVADGEIEAARRNVTVERNAFLPTISFATTVQLLIKGFNPYHVVRERFREGNFMAFELGITVPLYFGAQRARLRAANRDVEIARYRRAEAAAAAAADYAAAVDRVRSAAADLEYCSECAMPAAEEIERLARESYELGEMELADYISNIETATAARLRYADAVNNYNQSIIQLRYLQGI